MQMLGLHSNKHPDVLGSGRWAAACLYDLTDLSTCPGKWVVKDEKTSTLIYASSVKTECQNSDKEIEIFF
jgi:hypothetical protein